MDNENDIKLIDMSGDEIIEYDYEITTVPTPIWHKTEDVFDYVLLKIETEIYDKAGENIIRTDSFDCKYDTLARLDLKVKQFNGIIEYVETLITNIYRDMYKQELREDWMRYLSGETRRCLKLSDVLDGIRVEIGKERRDNARR